MGKNDKWIFELSQLLEEKHKNEIQLLEMLTELENEDGNLKLRAPRKNSIWNEVKKISDYIIKEYALDGKIIFKFWNFNKHLNAIQFIVQRLKVILNLIKGEKRITNEN